MTNPFSALSSGGSWLKPADRNGHLVIIANAQFVGRKYDEMRKADVDVVKFDFADLNGGEGWQIGVQSSHSGVTNKLTGILGNPEGKVLGRIGQVQANNGHLAWVLADATEADVPVAIGWLGQNPAPAAVPVFASLPPAQVLPPVVAPPVIAAQIPAPVVPAQATGPQRDVAALLAQLQAAQAQG